MLTCLLAAVLILPTLVFAVGNESINNLDGVVDSNNNPTASFFANLRTFLNQEDAARCTEQSLGSFIVTGGLHSTSGSLVSAAFGTTGYTSSCNRVNQASAAINYGTQGCAASDTAWVILSGSASDILSNFNRVSGTEYFVDCTNTSQPALPTDSAWLMQVTISGSAITAVTDLRRTSPGRGLPVVDCGTFGAVGDDATNNTTALQNCLNANNSQAGMRFLQRGTYRVRDKLLVPSSVCLTGEGMGRTIIKLDTTYDIGTDESILALDSVTGGCIRDLTVDVNQPNVTGITNISGIGGLFSDFIIEHVEVKNTIGGTNGGTGIHCNPPCNRNLIARNWIHDIGDPRTSTLVLTDASTTVTEGASSISGFSGLTVNAHANQFVQVSGGGITPITYRIISNTTTALDLGGQNIDFASGTYSSSIYSAMDIGDCIFLKGRENRIEGNLLERCADGMITDAGDDDVVGLSPHGNTVIGNVGSHTTSNGCMTVGPGSTGVISGNVFQNCGQNGLTMEGLGSRPYTQTLVVGNTFSAVGRDGITIDFFDGAHIVGNIFKRVGRRCIDVFGQNTYIAGNTCQEAGDSGFLLEGGSTVNTNASAGVTLGGTVVTGYAGLTADAFAGYWVVISGEAHRIVGNTTTQLSIQGTWALATSTYTANIYSTNAGTRIIGNIIRNSGFGNASGTACIRLIGGQYDVSITDNTCQQNSASGLAATGINNEGSPTGEIHTANNDFIGFTTPLVNPGPRPMPNQGKLSSVRATRSGAQTIGNAADTAITFDTESYDFYTLHSVASNTSRLVVAYSGLYNMGANVCFASNATGYRRAWIQRSTDSTVLAQDIRPAVNGTLTCMSFPAKYPLNAGEYIELYVHQTSTGNLDVTATSDYTPVLWMERIGD